MRKLHCMGLGMLVLLVGASLLPGSGRSAMIKLNLEQLTTEADIIVLGTVTSQKSAWDVQYTAIYTDVTVAVEKVIKGSPEERVTFRIAGGTVGEVGMRTSNDPVFQDGEHVIVFINTKGILTRLVGLYQGKFIVRDDGTVRSGEQTLTVADFIATIRAVFQQ